MDIADVGPDLARVARAAIRAHLAGRAHAARRPGAPAAPVFVTLRGPDRSLRGCIGTLRPVEPDVVAETARNAVLAATRDPRFSAVSEEELRDLGIEVSVLMPEQPVASMKDLDPARYGVVVRDGLGKQGVLLPAVPGIFDAGTQVRIAREKGGIVDDSAVKVHRFEVLKFAE